jgi:hypothetical protein
LLASASAKSWDKGVGVLVPDVCAKAENAVANTNIVVAIKETTFIRKLQSQMQFETSPRKRRHACALGKVECEIGAD